MESSWYLDIGGLIFIENKNIFVCSNLVKINMYKAKSRISVLYSHSYFEPRIIKILCFFFTL